MSVSTATADTPLRQAWPWLFRGQSGRLASRDLNLLFEVCFGLSRLRVPVSRSVLAVSSFDDAQGPEFVEGARTVMNHAD